MQSGYFEFNNTLQKNSQGKYIFDILYFVRQNVLDELQNFVLNKLVQNHNFECEKNHTFESRKKDCLYQGENIIIRLTFIVSDVTDFALSAV